MGGKPVLSGDVGFLNLGDILQLLGSNGATGILRLSSKYSPNPGLVYLVNGNPVHATIGPAAGLGALNSLFGWIEAEFEFAESSVECEKSIKKGRMNIILDGLSLLDEGEIEKLGPVSYGDDSSGEADKGPMLPLVKGPLVDYIYVVDEETFKEGQPIAVEGKHGNWIWVILEGTVRITKDSANGPVDIMRISDGAFVGSTASFGMDGNVRSASAIAEGDVQLGVLDAQQLVEDFARLTSDYREVANSLDRRLRFTTDYAVRMYLNQNPFKELIKDFKPIIKQGATEERLLSITQGRAVVIRKTESGLFVPLSELSAGDFFGYMPFLDMGQEPESASILGSEDLKVKALDTDALRSEHDRLSTTLRNFFEYMATCISVTTRMACTFQKKKN